MNAWLDGNELDCNQQGLALYLSLSLYTEKRSFILYRYVMSVCGMQTSSLALAEQRLIVVTVF